MAKEHNKINIVQLFNAASASSNDGADAKQIGEDVEEACQFIADMLEALIPLATKHERLTLVYLLSLARKEALEQIGRQS